MSFILIPMLLISSFVKFPFILNYQLRSDCYKSFTYPEIYLNLSHYYPSGPFYFSAIFYYRRNSILPRIGLQTEQAVYNFKKIDKPCRSSALFTTMGEELEKLHVNITIYLSVDVLYPIADILYNFYKGFKPGHYELISTNQLFIISMDIPELAGHYLRDRIRLFDEEAYYLSSLSAVNDKLCFISLYDVTIIKPKYISGLPTGYISAILFEAEIDKKITKIGIYSTFECKTHKKYSYVPVIFITEGKKDKISVRIIFWKYMNGSVHHFLQKIEILYSNNNYIDNLKYISRKYAKVFLIKQMHYLKTCLDGSKPTVFYSEKGIEYFSRIIKHANISYGVEMIRYFVLNPQDPCN